MYYVTPAVDKLGVDDDDDDDDDDCAENDNRDVGLMTECRLLVEIQYSQGCDILSACNGDPVPA